LFEENVPSVPGLFGLFIPVYSRFIPFSQSSALHKDGALSPLWVTEKKSRATRPVKNNNGMDRREVNCRANRT
jgi:hypothetical protein